MKKRVFGRQFKRDANERKALFKNLLTALVLSEKIETTEAKAKAIKGDADKLITKAKIGGVHAFRLLEAKVHHDAVVKLLEDLGPRFTNRIGGYTRIIKTKRRIADNAPMAILEWVEKKAVKAESKEQSAKSKEAASAKSSSEPKEKKTAPKKEVTKETKPAKKDVKKIEKKTTAKKDEKKSSSAKATEDKGGKK